MLLRLLILFFLKYILNHSAVKPSVSYRCVSTVLTPYLRPKVNYNSTQAIHVGGCDQGPLQYYIDYNKGNMVNRLWFNITGVEVTFLRFLLNFHCILYNKVSKKLEI